MTTNFFSTEINSTSTRGTFKNNGFYTLDNGDNKVKITTITQLKNEFNNELTKKNSEGNPMVQSITKNDIDTYIGKVTTDGDYVTGYDNLFAIPTKDQSGGYAAYYLAAYKAYTSYASPYHMWNIRYAGAIIGTSGEHGIRPVVTLKETVVKTGGSGTSSDPYTIGA